MKRIVVLVCGILIMSLMGYSQKVNEKKLLKKATALKASNSDRELVTLLYPNQDRYVKYPGKLNILLAESQLNILLLDSALISINRVIDQDSSLFRQAQPIKQTIVSKKEAYDTQMELAVSLIEVQKMGEARSDIEAALKIDSGNYQSWMLTGEIEQKVGSIDQSMVDFQIAAKKFVPSNEVYGEVLETIANAYLIRNQLDEAISWADKAISVSETAKEAFYIKGRAHYMRGKYEEAEVEAKNYTGLKSEESKGWILLGDCYFYQERWSSAITNYSAALNITDELPDVYSNRGICYYKTDQFTLAKSDFKELLQMFKGNYFALNALGVCEYKENNLEAASSYFDNALAFSLEEKYIFNAALVNFELSNYSKSNELASKLLERNDFKPEYIYLKIKSLMNIKDLYNAKMILDKAINANPRFPDYYNLKAEILEIEGDSEKAFENKRIAYALGGNKIDLVPIF